jgi:hypothetical protein
VQYGQRVASRVRDVVQVRHQLRAEPSSTGFRRDAYGRDASDADSLAPEPGLEREQEAVRDDDPALLENPHVLEAAEGVIAQIADPGVVASCIGVRVRMDGDQPLDVLRARLA